MRPHKQEQKIGGMHSECKTLSDKLGIPWPRTMNGDIQCERRNRDGATVAAALWEAPDTPLNGDNLFTKFYFVPLPYQTVCLAT